MLTVFLADTNFWPTGFANTKSSAGRPAVKERDKKSVN